MIFTNEQYDNVLAKIDQFIQTSNHLERTYSKLSTLQTALKGFESLGRSSISKMMHNHRDFPKADTLQRWGHSISEAMSRFSTQRREGIDQLRKQGIEVAAIMESLGLQSGLIRNIVATPNVESIRKTYPAMRRLRFSLDVAMAAAEMAKTGQLPEAPRLGHWQNLDAPSKADRRNRQHHAKRGLTPRQTEALFLFGAHDGNKTAAAKAMGVTRQAYDEHYKAAMKNLGKEAQPRPKTVSLPLDKRLQVAVSDPSDDE